MSCSLPEGKVVSLQEMHWASGHVQVWTPASSLLSPYGAFVCVECRVCHDGREQGRRVVRGRVGDVVEPLGWRNPLLQVAAACCLVSSRLRGAQAISVQGEGYVNASSHIQHPHLRLVISLLCS